MRRPAPPRAASVQPPVDVRTHGQLVGVGEERQRGDRDDPGRQAVQAVDEVDRVDRDTIEQDGDRYASPAEGQRRACPGTGTRAAARPLDTMTPAASTWPASLVSASSSQRSSSAPSTQMTPRRPAARSNRGLGERLTAASAAPGERRAAGAKPANIATPPRRGVGTAWTSRSRGRSRAPPACRRRASGVSREVTAAATQRDQRTRDWDASGSARRGRSSMHIRLPTSAPQRAPRCSGRLAQPSTRSHRPAGPAPRR